MRRISLPKGDWFIGLALVVVLIWFLVISYNMGFHYGFVAGKASVDTKHLTIHRTLTSWGSMMDHCTAWEATVDGDTIVMKATCKDKAPNASK